MEDDLSPLPRERSARGCGRLARRLPILRWAPQYDRTRAVADVVAGVTLGLTLVPQSIAYAALANLPVQYGLYSAFIGTMLYVVLGTVKEVSIGPTSLMALLTLQTCRDLPVQYMVLLTFLSGCLVLLMGLLKLGFLVELISPAVTSGFTSATALLIVAAQLKGLLGLSFVAESLVDNLQQIVHKWHNVRTTDAALAAVCCTALLALRKLKDVRVNPKRYRLKKTLWLISISRNALVVFAASIFAYYTYDPKQPLFKLSGKVEPGLPRIALPPFSVEVGNRTVGFLEMATQLRSGLMLMPFVMVLANIAIAKAFSNGGRVDAAQEMVTLGVCNVVGSLVGAMPTCGAFTRSAVSHSSGVRSPAAGLYAGIITLLALNYLTQYFFFIPKACLSSVLICAVIFMIDITTVRQLWSGRRREALVAGATWAVGVCVSVEAAVPCGALASLGGLLADLVREPELYLTVDKASGTNVLVVRPRRALVYVNAESVCARIRAAVNRRDVAHPAVLVDCSKITMLDYTAAQALGRLIKELESDGRQIIFYKAEDETARWLKGVPGINNTAVHDRSVRDALQHYAPDTKPASVDESVNQNDLVLHYVPEAKSDEDAGALLEKSDRQQV